MSPAERPVVAQMFSNVASNMQKALSEIRATKRAQALAKSPSGGGFDEPPWSPATSLGSASGGSGGRGGGGGSSSSASSSSSAGLGPSLGGHGGVGQGGAGKGFLGLGGGAHGGGLFGGGAGGGVAGRRAAGQQQQQAPAAALATRKFPELPRGDGDGVGGDRGRGRDDAGAGGGGDGCGGGAAAATGDAARGGGRVADLLADAAAAIAAS